MPTPSILSIFSNYLQQDPKTSLQISFASLNILNYKGRQYLNQVQKHKSRIILLKLPHKHLAEITVLDNPVFSFSFQFLVPNNTEFHSGKMRSLPRPLNNGRYFMDEEKLVLTYTIDAPDPLLRVEVTHVYTGILGVEQFHTPLYRHDP
ncbi:hypothetical protein [Allomuricauda sp. NBRC 101325]|uniref:hypothetical protein n=1 Tax=Allomuricauda sp. NBRC 101325 TaxID=1113758 RepID=UPI0024A04324|nr:hypothetical protein [Muricauda sp. NBRC 101325]GLU43647.1 hypothetical protein Musp01_12710 [Muricauda sp. NBRC 101325]